MAIRQSFICDVTRKSRIPARTCAIMIGTPEMLYTLDLQLSDRGVEILRDIIAKRCHLDPATWVSGKVSGEPEPASVPA